VEAFGALFFFILVLSSSCRSLLTFFDGSKLAALEVDCLFVESLFVFGVWVGAFGWERADMARSLESNRFRPRSSSESLAVSSSLPDFLFPLSGILGREVLCSLRNKIMLPGRRTSFVEGTRQDANGDIWNE
jgi:hypothetical protein